MERSNLAATKQASHRGTVQRSDRRGVNRARSSVQGRSRLIAKVADQVIEQIEQGNPVELRTKLEIENGELRDAVVRLALDLQTLRLNSPIK